MFASGIDAFFPLRKLHNPTNQVHLNWFNDRLRKMRETLGKISIFSVSDKYPEAKQFYKEFKKDYKKKLLQLKNMLMKTLFWDRVIQLNLRGN